MDYDRHMKNDDFTTRRVLVAGGAPEERAMIAAALFPAFLPAEPSCVPDLCVVLPSEAGRPDGTDAFGSAAWSALCPRLLLTEEGRPAEEPVCAGALPRTAVLPRICPFETLRAAAASLCRITDTPDTAWRLSGCVLSRGAAAVTLSRTEAALTACLLQADGPVPLDELCRAGNKQQSENACRVMLSGLRKKLSAAFGDGVLLSLRGSGYRLLR